MNHCKTCKHFKPIYPYNGQLGNCEYLEISNNQPCGHTISGRNIDTKVFTTEDNRSRLPEHVNRVMDDFGCVYHIEKPKNVFLVLGKPECQSKFFEATQFFQNKMPPMHELISSSRQINQSCYEITLNEKVEQAHVIAQTIAGCVGCVIKD